MDTFFDLMIAYFDDIYTFKLKDISHEEYILFSFPAKRKEIECFIYLHIKYIHIFTTSYMHGQNAPK